MSSISLHEGGGGSAEVPVTRGEVVSILEEARRIEEEGKELILGIDNVWQALVIGVLGYVLIDRLCQHFFGDRKTREIEKAINGFGVDKDGKKITLAVFVRQQMRIEKENRALLHRICRHLGIRREDV